MYKIVGGILHRDRLVQWWVSEMILNAQSNLYKFFIAIKNETRAYIIKNPKLNLGVSTGELD